MGNKIWRRLGRLFFLITWPIIWIVIKLSLARTRVLIICKGETLLVKDWLGSGKWKLPGGGLRRGEDPKLGAVRELLEEVAITTTPDQLKHLADFKTHSNGMATNIVAFTLHLKSKPEVHKQAYEISDYTWWPIDDIDQNKISETTQTVLRNFKKS